MNKKSRTMRSSSGLSLHLYQWEPDDVSNRQGAVIISHGLGEHCGRYGHVAAYFTKRGFSVYGADHAGFGRSDGRRGDVVGALTTYTEDLLQVVDLAGEHQGKSTRKILLGHSMGGLVVLQLLLDHPQAAKEAVLSGPALNVGQRLHPLLRKVARAFGRILPFVTIDHGIPAKEICSDPKVVKKYMTDPLVHRRISPRLIASMIDGGERVRSSAARLSPDLALLLVHGGQDRISSPEDTQEFGQRVACEKKEVLIPAEMKHEVFNETEKARVFDTVEDFFELPPVSEDGG
jgi:alpha-beta hydrolase superfamily lysophospholipase